jgi:hypothetical protein
MRKKRRKIWIALVLVVILLGGLILLYSWMQADPRLQEGMTEKEVGQLLGTEGTHVALNSPPAGLPYATYYVFYDQGPDAFGNNRVVTVYYDRGGKLLKYEVSPLPRSRPNWLKS